MSDEPVVGSPEREIHVQAIVQLEKISLDKQEENEEELFKMRAKLYRYFTTDDESGWKERGIGEIKITKHKTKGTFRVVMRRDKTLKLCANHAILGDMEIKPHMGGEKALIWTTPSDFADGEAKAEMLCVRFGKPESATEFKKIFEECVCLVKNNKNGDKLADDLSSLKVKDEKDDGENKEKEEESTKKSDGEKDDKDTKNDGDKNETDKSEKPKD